MNVKSAFPSRYIAASDLGEAKVLVKISKVEQAHMPDGTSKPVVFFEGKAKGLALNKTNGKRIAEIQGGSWDSDDWIGLEIIIYATETEFQGETVECVRVMDPSKVKKKPAKPEPVTTEEELGIEDDDRVPF